MKKGALFIDRDGVINHMVLQDNGTFDSPQTIEQVLLFDGIVELLRWLITHDIPIIEISNQPAVAKGKLSMEELELIEKKVHSLLNENDVHIDAIYRCFHHPQAIIKKYKKDCDCRKPKGGLLIQAALEMNIDLPSSIFLGDNITDIETGYGVGCYTILFPHTPHLNDTPENLSTNKAYKNTHLVSSLAEVVPTIAKIWHI